MEKRSFPMVCFELHEAAMLGIVLGSYDQVVKPTLKEIRTELRTYLQKEYKRYGYYPNVDLKTPKLKILDVPIRPVYQSASSSYPTASIVNLSIPIVYGEVGEGHYECHLPLFQDSFFYYEEDQLDTLATYWIRNFFSDKSPETIYAFMQFPKPSLDSVSLRIKDETAYSWDYWSKKRRFKTLERLAEQQPVPKAVRKHSTLLPDAAWELEEEVLDLMHQVLSSRANVLIVGEHGVGKSAIIQQAVKRINNRSRAEQLALTFWRIMPQRITASAKYIGEWQESVESLIEDLISANGILWVEQVIQLLLSGGEGAEDSIAAFMLPYLQQHKIQLLGEVTPKELESMRRLLPGFVEHFQLIKVEALPEKKVLSVLNQFSDYSAKQWHVEIQQSARMQAYRLLARYFPYEVFPGKGIKFLGQCVNRALLLQQTQVTTKLVTELFVQQTGLPELFLRDDMLLNQAEIENYFSQQIIGQNNAISTLCDIVKIYKAGLNDPNKPIATLLFAGPTGVGKTASAKALAKYFFGKGQKQSPLIRIDMSEFQYPAQITRFIGDGKQVGQLVKAVRERPFSVLLLDEVEKANPAIFDALLTVLDEGILVDHYGRTTNFRNTIVIMTTNLGASHRKSVSFTQTSSDQALYESAIGKFFRPEFVNRLDHIVLFNALQAEDIERITVIELENLCQREGFVKRGLQLHFSDRLVKQITTLGFDERYGARPLQRAVEQTIVGPMAKWLLNHPNTNDQQLHLDFDRQLLITTTLD